jgi:hypothetical protein
MATIRETILDAILSFLNTGTPGGVPQAKRSFLYTIDSAQLPSITFYAEKEDATVQHAENMAAITLRVLTVVVECRAQGDATNRPDEILDPLLSWVVKALSGRRATDSTGPYHLIFEDSTEWDYEQADHAYAMATVRIGVQYQSKVNDPEAWA